MRADLKSFLLGAVLVVILFTIIGQTTKQSYPVGRFQIFMPHTNDQIPYLLDTKSGCTWKWLWNQETQKFGWAFFPMADSTERELWKIVLNTY